MRRPLCYILRHSINLGSELLVLKEGSFGRGTTALQCQVKLAQLLSPRLYYLIKFLNGILLPLCQQLQRCHHGLFRDQGFFCINDLLLHASQFCIEFCVLLPQFFVFVSGGRRIGDQCTEPAFFLYGLTVYL